jgi:23S rRNA (cytidine1920-2'-O)/16S rRNA (cytidine1409-2'-O)-methyltransferase
MRPWGGQLKIARKRIFFAGRYQIRTSPVKRERLDALLLDRGLVESREQAERLILAGRVFVKGRNDAKPGQSFPADIEIRVADADPYVSRGGLKLEAALGAFRLSPAGLDCADVGASTGGFTDCLLQNGAARVYAIDVGSSQLHERLRTDSRVFVMEQRNARELRPADFAAPPRFIAVDVSFISIVKVLPALAEVSSEDATCVALIKPQFEAGRADVSRGKGVIRDEEVHRQILRDVLNAIPATGWMAQDIMGSPIVGASGNREFLAWLRKNRDSRQPLIDIDAVIASTR